MKSIIHDNDKYLYVMTKRHGIILKEKVYVSTRYYTNNYDRLYGDVEYEYPIMRKETITWYCSAVIIPCYFVYYLLSCIVFALAAIVAFRFDKLFSKETYVYDNEVYEGFISALDECIHPSYYNYSNYVRSNKKLKDEELVRQAKARLEQK